MKKELNDNIFQDYLLELLHLNSKYDILNVGSAFDEISNGVPLDAIRELLGHTDLATTLGYIYNPLPEKDTYELISKAL